MIALNVSSLFPDEIGSECITWFPVTLCLTVTFFGKDFGSSPYLNVQVSQCHQTSRMSDSLRPKTVKNNNRACERMVWLNRQQEEGWGAKVSTKPQCQKLKTIQVDVNCYKIRSALPVIFRCLPKTDLYLSNVPINVYTLVTYVLYLTH